MVDKGGEVRSTQEIDLNVKNPRRCRFGHSTSEEIRSIGPPPTEASRESRRGRVGLHQEDPRPCDARVSGLGDLTGALVERSFQSNLYTRSVLHNASIY